MRVTSPGPRLYCHNLDDNLMSTPIGLSVKRREDRRFLTGQGRYVDDLRLPDLLHAAIVRSPRLRPYAQPALAGPKARHAGKAVAVVVADDVYLATDAAQLVDVHYDVLPAVATVDAALATGAARVFDE